MFFSTGNQVYFSFHVLPGWPEISCIDVFISIHLNRGWANFIIQPIKGYHEGPILCRRYCSGESGHRGLQSHTYVAYESYRCPVQHFYEFHNEKTGQDQDDDHRGESSASIVDYWLFVDPQEPREGEQIDALEHIS